MAVAAPAQAHEQTLLCRCSFNQIQGKNHHRVFFYIRARRLSFFCSHSGSSAARPVSLQALETLCQLLAHALGGTSAAGCDTGLHSAMAVTRGCDTGLHSAMAVAKQCHDDSVIVILLSSSIQTHKLDVPRNFLFLYSQLTCAYAAGQPLARAHRSSSMRLFNAAPQPSAAHRNRPA